MKKRISFACVLFLFTAVFAQNTVDLSVAIEKSSKEISTVVPSKSKIAVATFFSDSKELSSYLAQEVVKKLMQRGTFTVIERNEKNMSLVNAEVEYQYSGSVSDDSMVEFGNRLGAQFLVYGAFDQLGGMLQFTIQVTNVESGEIPYLTSYSITKTSRLTELLGDDMEMNTAEDFLNAIARCQRKLTSIEKDKSKAVQNQSSRIYASYQSQLNEITAEAKNPWESKAEYDARINEAVNSVVKKRDTELGGVEKSVSISYDNQAKQVEIQKDKLIKDLQNTTFSLSGNSVQVMLGAFDAESKPKNWPVSIKSLDRQVSYTYNGNYVVNDADVKTEYQTVEEARSNDDFEGEITYRIIESSSKNSFDVFVVSVRIYIKSTGSAIVNENINKSVGILNANKLVSGAASKNTSDTKEVKASDAVQSSPKKVSTAVKAAVERDYQEYDNYSLASSENPFENSANFEAHKTKGTMVISDTELEFEGSHYKGISISGNTGAQKSDWSDYWAAACWSNPQMQSFLAQGDTLKFKVIGDGKIWSVSFVLYDNNNSSSYRYEFPTKNGKVSEITIPYSKLKFEEWSVCRKFDKNEIKSIGIYGNNVGVKADRSIKIFDVRVF